MDFITIGAIWAVAAPIVGICAMAVYNHGQKKKKALTEEDRQKRKEARENRREAAAERIAQFISLIFGIGMIAGAIWGVSTFINSSPTPTVTPQPTVSIKPQQEKRQEEVYREPNWDDLISEDSEMFPLYLYEHAVGADSSSILCYAYSRRFEKLGIIFRNNPESFYIYSRIPGSVYSEFKNADSMGSYYANNIKGKYPCLEVELD